MYQIIKKESDFVLLENETTKEITKLKLIRQHKELGNFYVFNSILAMPYQRKVVFDMIQQFNNIGIDKTELLKETAECLELLQNKENGYDLKVYNKLANINNTVKGFWDYKKSAMLIATLLIVHENDLQTIGVFDQEISEKRIKEWAIDSELLGFFLNITQQKCNNLINKLDFDIPTFLPQVHQSTESQPQIKKENLLKRITAKLTKF